MFTSRACGHNSSNPSKHAECQLIDWLSLKGLSGKHAPNTICSLRMIQKNGEIIFGQSMPCTHCATRIFNFGIKKVIFCIKNEDGDLEIVKGNIDDIIKVSKYSGGTRRKSSN